MMFLIKRKKLAQSQYSNYCEPEYRQAIDKTEGYLSKDPEINGATGRPRYKHLLERDLAGLISCCVEPPFSSGNRIIYHIDYNIAVIVEHSIKGHPNAGDILTRIIESNR